MITDWIKTKPSDDGNHVGMRIGYRNLPKGLDKNCYEQIYMSEQEQIDALRTRIERIEAKLKLNMPEKPTSTEPDYTHLLPEGYEFCEEAEAEKWVKVNKNIGIAEIGALVDQDYSDMSIEFKSAYRPIRQIKYHVAVHEAVTAEPDPYQVDWSKAPDWADSHAYDKYSHGAWMGFSKGGYAFEWAIRSSGYTLPSGLDWKQSKRRRPQ